MNLNAKHNVLNETLKNMESVVVGFSGGVDSTFLLKAAENVLKDRVLAVTLSSSVFPKREMDEALSLAKEIGARHKVVKFDEFKIEGFSENSKNRCYYCKRGLFSMILDMAKTEGYKFVLDGSNIDDMGDYRPGMTAARELGVRSPLIEAGLSKSDIRILSKEMNLPTWNRPSFACLASRIPYGQEITSEKLEMVGGAEQYLYDLGFNQFRVRHHGDTARIEVSPDERVKLFDIHVMDDIAEKLRRIGFSYVSLDLSGYRTGSLNEVLNRE